MSDLGYSIRGALFEALFVVLGVVLALGANEWREYRNDRDHAELALAAIVEELRSNREAMSTSVEYHSGLLDMIRQKMAAGDQPGLRDFHKGFTSPALLYRTAFEAAVMINALEFFEYEKVLAISALYAKQERYEQQTSIIGTLIYTRLYEEGVSGVIRDPGNLASIIGTYIYRENEMIKQYDHTLELVGELRPEEQ